MAAAASGSFPSGADMTKQTGQGEEWELKKYGRLRMPGTTTQTKIFEVTEESGGITLTILHTGHFLISQGHTLLEGFSLNSAKNWLKVGKKADCLLFGSTAKDVSSMFRVQFKGESKGIALNNCDQCFQKLQGYLADQNVGPRDSVQSFPEQRINITHAAQSLLNGQADCLGTFHHKAFPSVQELGHFIKLCLLDQHFPAFVEAVEKELHKLTED
ncbi:meiotic recombination protein REC114 [Hyperolius riggenbachi]|uniref:meiotic recombination protein REC114 n=1 Tax=Hyperolius riggenbachi TaxID=752182 RepID=UPI0035A30E0A